jgi:hypothetical protein
MFVACCFDKATKRNTEYTKNIRKEYREFYRRMENMQQMGRENKL